jgi:hypothetical protein
MKAQAAAGTGGIDITNKNAAANIAATTVPALGDSIPQFYLGLGTFANVTYPFPGLTGIAQTKANLYLGSTTGYSTNWDISRFCQLFQTTESYAGTANQFIESACNANDYLCDTFSNTDNMITGDITTVNLATESWGQDLANLGQLINLDDLDNLGSPLALIRQITNLVGAVPIVALAFVAEGVPDDVVVGLSDPNLDVTDSEQKAMYRGMEQITGNPLQQILNVLGVKTVGITTMADLLNPVKLFPNSFQSLTVVTPVGQRGIYTNLQGDVNTTLLSELPNYVISSTQ